MIEIKNLSVGYRREPILKNLNFSLPKAQITAIIGPNACGKSTFLKSLQGLLPLLSGEILYDGRSLKTMSNKETARIMAYLSQTRPDAHISVRRMVLHGRFPHIAFPRRYKQEDLDIAEQAMIRADVLKIADQPMSELSGGQRQRVYFAMALAQDTPVILMDEPGTWLDIRYQMELLERLRHLADEGKTIVLVSPDLCQTLSIADQVILLDKGTARFVGSSEALFESSLIDEIFSVSLRTAVFDGFKYYFLK